MIGTAGDPTSRAARHARPTIGWTEAARRANIVGAAARGRGHQVLLPRRAELLPVLQRPGPPGARPRAPDRLVHRRTPTRARLLRAGHLPRSPAARASRSRSTAADCSTRPAWYGRLAQANEPAHRLARQGRRPARAAARTRRRTRSRRRRARRLPAQRRRPTRLRGRGLDRPGLPGRPRPRGDRLQAAVRRGRREGLALLIAESDSGPGPAHRPRPLAPPREGEPRSTCSACAPARRRTRTRRCDDEAPLESEPQVTARRRLAALAVPASRRRLRLAGSACGARRPGRATTSRPSAVPVVREPAVAGARAAAARAARRRRRDAATRSRWRWSRHRGPRRRRRGCSGTRSATRTSSSPGSSPCGR